jgi:hypothetical protein
MAEDWDLFEDALQCEQRRRRELVARLRARLATTAPKLSEEQVAAVVERMADFAMRNGMTGSG